MHSNYLGGAPPQMEMAIRAAVVVFAILGIVYLYRMFWTKTCPMPKMYNPFAKKDEMLGADPATYTPQSMDEMVWAY